MTSVTVLVSSSNLTVAKDLIILAELTPLIASGYIFIKKPDSQSSKILR